MNQPAIQLVRSIISFMMLIKGKGISEAIFADAATMTIHTISPTVHAKAAL